MWELEKCSVMWAVPRTEEGNEVHGGETRPSPIIQTRNFWNDIGLGNVHKHVDVAMTLHPARNKSIIGGKACQLAHHGFP